MKRSATMEKTPKIPIVALSEVEQALKNSELRYRRLFEAAQDLPVYTWTS